MTDTNRLHLPDLTIKGFRGIDELSIPRLGRVTLLAGKNGVGKTTVLDAVRVYATRGRYRDLSRLLRDREEMSVVIDEDGDITSQPDWTALFYDRDFSPNFLITIGPNQFEDPLYIELTLPTDEMLPLLDLSGHESPIQVIKVVFRRRERFFSFGISTNESGQYRSYVRIPNDSVRRRVSHLGGNINAQPEVICESLGPALLNNDDLSRYWDNVELTDDKEATLAALRLMYDSGIDDAAMIGDLRMVSRRAGRRPMVRFKGHSGRVPLKSLGDGALRLFGVALALANTRNGFLLIDEAENGIHHSLQRDFWNMILRTAHENNVQVLATTHSWDCVTGFAQAASELEDVEGVLVRLSRSGGDLRAVEYPEEELAIAAEQGIEVR